jgi:hypothetical protein
MHLNFEIGGGYEVISAYESRDQEVLRFISESPEYTIYHAESYINFSAKYNKFAGLYAIKNSGRSLVVIPLHWIGYNRYTSGYSGILFPKSDNEKILKMAVQALVHFLRSNSNIEFNLMQSLQAAGGFLRERTAAIASLISRDFDLLGGTYSRAIRLSGLVGAGQDVSLGAVLLINQYDSKIRNQIRNGLKKGLEVNVNFIDTDSISAIESKLASLHSLLVQCRRETGMGVKDLGEWCDKCRAVTSAGGQILLVELIHQSVICAVTLTYISGRSALYWMGFSNFLGKQISASAIGLHQSIIESQKLGLDYYEVGRTDYRGERLNKKEMAITQFKDQFGGGVYWIMRVFQMPTMTVTERARNFVGRVAAKLKRVLRASC